MHLSKFKFELQNSNSWVKMIFDMENIDKDIFYLEFSENISTNLKRNILKNIPKKVLMYERSW